MIRQFSDVLSKNVKITIRNWTYIIFLILGPALLIFIVGLTLGQGSIHNAHIGVVAEQNPAIDNFLGELQKEVKVVEYDDIFQCIENTKRENIDACLRLSQLSKTENVTSFLITVYYDSSKFSLSSNILNYIKLKVGEVEKEVTTQTIQSMISTAAEFNVFVVSTKDFVNQSRQDLVDMKASMQATKVQLATIQIQFSDVYVSLKTTQAQLNQNVPQFLASKAKIDSELIQFDTYSVQILQYTSNIRSQISFVPENQRAEIDSELNQIDTSITNMQDGIADYRQSTADLPDMLNNLTANLNQLIIFMESVNSFLSQSQTQLDANIVSINDGITRLESVQGQLDDTSKKLSSFLGIKTGTLTTPIIPLFKPLFPEYSTIYLFFPTLLCLVIAFLGIWLADIFILNETQSKGYIRNFITPASDVLFLFNSFFIILLIVLFQAAVLLLIARYYFAIDVLTNFPSLAIGIILLSAIFVEIGMILGYVFKSVHISVLSSTFIALALFLFGDIIAAPELNTPVIGFAVKMNPLVFGESLFRKIFFQGSFITTDIINLAKIGVFLLILTAAVVAAHYINKRRL